MARKTTAAAPGGEEEFGQVFGPMAILARWEADDGAWRFPTSMIKLAAGTAPCYERAREERLRKILTGVANSSTPEAGHAWRNPDSRREIVEPAMAAVAGGEW